MDIHLLIVVIIFINRSFLIEGIRVKKSLKVIFYKFKNSP